MPLPRSVKKTPHTPFCFCGTTCATGEGKMLVCAVGWSTHIGEPPSLPAHRRSCCSACIALPVQLGCSSTCNRNTNKHTAKELIYSSHIGHAESSKAFSSSAVRELYISTKPHDSAVDSQTCVTHCRQDQERLRRGRREARGVCHARHGPQRRAPGSPEGQVWVQRTHRRGPSPPSLSPGCRRLTCPSPSRKTRSWRASLGMGENRRDDTPAGLRGLHQS